MRLARKHRDLLLIAAAAAASTLLAQSSLVSGAAAFVIGAAGPALLPALLLWGRRGERRRTYAFLQRLIDEVPDPFYVKDAGSRYVMVNKAYARERGRPAGEIVGTTTEENMGAEAPALIAEDRAALAGESVGRERVVRNAGTGEEAFRMITKRRVESERGAPLVIGYHHDITRWKVAERSLQAALERQKSHAERTLQFAQRLLDALPMPVYVKDAESRYIIVNRTQMREWQRPAEELIGRTSMSLAPNEEIRKIMRDEDAAVLVGGSVYKEEENYHPVTGKGRFRVVTKERCTDVDGAPVIVCTMFDTTAWRKAERELKEVLERETELRKQLEQVAFEDALTGLANRRCFLAEVERVFASADRHGQAVSLLLFDLDHFKRINDQHSHQAGDDVLRRVAERCRDCLRAEDMPARWGGEEFVVLLPSTAQPQAMQVAHRLREALAASPIPTCAGALPVTLSCGVAQRRNREPVAALIARADSALYQAKDGGRNACVAAPLD